MKPNDRQFQSQADTGQEALSEAIEHQYHQAMSQDPRFMTDEDKDEMSRYYDTQAKEQK